MMATINSSFATPIMAMSFFDIDQSANWNRWTWSLPIVLPLFGVEFMYALGFYLRLTSPGHPDISCWRPLLFVMGWISLFGVLLSPMHELGEQLFWVHMTQHEILVLVCAPLLVLGHPMLVSLWALPLPARKAIAAGLNKTPVKATWKAISSPLSAWTLHALALWIWHIPALFQATLTSDGVHAAQHISFLATALLFWWALLKPQGGQLGYGGGSYMCSLPRYTPVCWEHCSRFLRIRGTRHMLQLKAHGV